MLPLFIYYRIFSSIKRILLNMIDYVDLYNTIITQNKDYLHMFNLNNIVTFFGICMTIVFTIFYGVQVTMRVNSI